MSMPGATPLPARQPARLPIRQRWSVAVESRPRAAVSVGIITRVIHSPTMANAPTAVGAFNAAAIQSVFGGGPGGERWIGGQAVSSPRTGGSRRKRSEYGEAQGKRTRRKAARVSKVIRSHQTGEKEKQHKLISTQKVHGIERT